MRTTPTRPTHSFPLSPENDALMTDLPIGFNWPNPSRTRLQPAVLVVVLLGLVSAGLIGWGMGMWSIAIIYGGLLFGFLAVSYAWSMGRQKRGGDNIGRALVRATINASTEALAVTDQQGQLVCANASYGRLCGGYPSPFDLGVEPARLHALADAARRGQPGRLLIEQPGDSGDGGTVLRIDCATADDPDDHLVWMVRPSFADRQVAQARILTLGAMGGILADAGVASLLTDASGTVLDANNHAFALLAAPREAVLGASLAQFLVADATQQPLLTPREREPIPVRLIEMPLRTAAGADPHAYLLLVLPGLAAPPPVSGAPSIDVVMQVIDNLPLGLATIDREGRLHHCNAAFWTVIGDRSRVLLYPSDFVIDDDKGMLADSVRKIVSQPEAFRQPLDVTVRIQGRAEDPVRLSLFPVYDLHPAQAVLALWDDPEQRKLERQIAQASKMQAVGQLAGGVAHDFNNILTAIIGYSDLMLMRHAPGDTDFADVTQIKQNANRAAGLVRQLLAFSRQQTLRPERLDIADVLSELSHLLHRLLGEKIQFRMVQGRGVGAVRADRTQLEQVLVNLAVNARDAMAPDGGTLTITTGLLRAADVRALGRDIMPANDYVRIAVSDTGCGIPPENLGKIFEPFFTTKEVGKGTGLGLSTVYGIIKQTGGFIFADSTIGEGTTFTVYLPVHSEEDAPAKASTTEAPTGVPQPPEDLWGAGRLLLVEDEDNVRAILRRALERKGYDVQCASNGEEAMTLIHAADPPIQLLISDVVMPTMDGPTLVGKARELIPDLRVILISGYAEEQLRQLMDSTNFIFLPKPFSVQQLAEVVGRALQSP